MKYILLMTLCVLFIGHTVGQNIEIGQWRTHFSYQNLLHVEATQDKVFAASRYGFFSYTLSTQEIRKLSKIDGLSDSGVSALGYNAENNTLVIGYRSGFLDFVYADKMISVDDISNSNLIKDKMINAIAFSPTRTYVGSGFGIIEIETSTATIRDNFIQIGIGGSEPVIFDIVYQDEVLYVRTSEGLQIGSVSQNLSDFNNWTHRASSTSALVLGDKVYYSKQDSVFILDKSAHSTFVVRLPGNKLLASSGRVFSQQSEQLYTLDGNIFQPVSFPNISKISDISFFKDELVVVDSLQGVIFQNTKKNILPNGLLPQTITNMKVLSNKLYVFYAPPPENWDGASQVKNFSVFTDGIWKNQRINNFSNVSDVTLLGDIRYFSSIGSGLYNENTKQIITDIPETSTEADNIINGLTTHNGQMWLITQNSDALLSFNGTDWSSYGGLLSNTKPSLLKIAELGRVWLLESNGTIAVLNTNESTVNFLGTADNIPGDINSFDIGPKDEVWIATDKGPAFYGSASLISTNEQAIRPVFKGRTLLENEHIHVVKTDAGSRIWFGTTKGLWVFDEATSDQVHLFNESNSPLLSDNVIDLQYDPTTGEMYILTDEGLLSYRSASSTGGPRHSSQVAIFPNPVRPNYLGNVGLSGLATGVSVKITDINGNLVNTIFSNGGTAAWNLTTEEGEIVNSGVYFFFSATEDGQETYVGKIAVIR